MLDKRNGPEFVNLEVKVIKALPAHCSLKVCQPVEIPARLNRIGNVYHLVKIDGKTFYFVEGEKKDYYYTYVYLRKEPSDEQKHKWELDGWKYICRQRGKKKRHAGWFVFRNEDVPGDYRKYIENDLEKYNFFKKEVKSYGSTQMIFFLCIIVCAVCAYIQYRYNGYLIGIA
ncbi:MAG: DUF2812 domain-containing protein, partial [Mogibacterium sp.]|nr:DUF2812 domain-containing protein [Mogibacterium sp.]